MPFAHETYPVPLDSSMLKLKRMYSSLQSLHFSFILPTQARLTLPIPERAFWSNPKVSESVSACIVHDRMSYLVDSAWHITLWYAHMRHKIKHAQVFAFSTIVVRQSCL